MKYVSSFLFGAAFAAGWTPCAGAALGSILGLAASQSGAASLLLIAYALGFSLPFLLLSLFITSARPIIHSLIRWAKPIYITFGILLIGFGILVFTQTAARFANLQFILSIFSP